MRIMLTVLGEQGDRDVVAEVDDGVTIAQVAEALSGQEPMAKVVRLGRARAPYGMSGSAPTRIPSPREPERGDGLGQEGPVVWRNGRPLDSRALARAVLHEGDRITLDPRHAKSTIIQEPAGVAEVRVVGGPAAGSVHRLSLGTHVLGSDEMCAVAVHDPTLAPEAAILRVTPDAITIEPVRRERPPNPPRRKIKGRYAEELTELADRDEQREADRWAEAERARYPDFDDTDPFGAPAASSGRLGPAGTLSTGSARTGAPSTGAGRSSAAQATPTPGGRTAQPGATSSADTPRVPPRPVPPGGRCGRRGTRTSTASRCTACATGPSTRC
ncbi:FHA domain-containing protein [Nonomuraea sp. NBC_01738]|uniref:hypothetical protein n=1 Tax=Nonomuraea sp. NBC_01738 TaxID=2976003 RepID=UPI002E0D0F7A|nr:FHA domain-containing protein [Nonomuraea sp. NBC_01738]